MLRVIWDTEERLRRKERRKEEGESKLKDTQKRHVAYVSPLLNGMKGLWDNSSTSYLRLSQSTIGSAFFLPYGGAGLVNITNGDACSSMSIPHGRRIELNYCRGWGKYQWNIRTQHPSTVCQYVLVKFSKIAIFAHFWPKFGKIGYFVWPFSPIISSDTTLLSVCH